jgi:hypothetical protein
VSKIETATSDIEQGAHQDVSALRDDELDAVTGGRKSPDRRDTWFVALAKAMGSLLD